MTRPDNGARLVRPDQEAPLSIITPEQRDAARTEPTVRAEVRITVNPWGAAATLERTYGPPRKDGFGAKRAVRKYAEALRRLAE